MIFVHDTTKGGLHSAIIHEYTTYQSSNLLKSSFTHFLIATSLFHLLLKHHYALRCDFSARGPFCASSHPKLSTCKLTNIAIHRARPATRPQKSSHAQAKPPPQPSSQKRKIPESHLRTGVPSSAALQPALTRAYLPFLFRSSPPRGLKHRHVHLSVRTLPSIARMVLRAVSPGQWRPVVAMVPCAGPASGCFGKEGSGVFGVPLGHWGVWKMVIVGRW